MNNFGIVVIGRNEGERLIYCLKSLKTQVSDDVPIVYVDSGSSDSSVEAAQALEIQTIELDPSIPFSMARGRNAGFYYLTQQYQLEYVQFIDGDCELVKGWLEKAIQAFESHDESLAIVCGRRRERFPEISIYNQLADIEWDKPIGEIKACGGDALVRVKAIHEVDGYNETLICGEEPEMCIRLRRKGWKIICIDVNMTLHDAAITTFIQWWKRSVRSGWAGAQGMNMYGNKFEHYKVRECIRCWLWGPLLLLGSIGLAWLTDGLSLLLLLVYPIQIVRIYLRCHKRGKARRHALLYSLFSGVLINIPHVIGQLRYWLSTWGEESPQLIEYKEKTF